MGLNLNHSTDTISSSTGGNITVTNLVIPTASSSTLGGIKVGTGLTIDGTGSVSVSTGTGALQVSPLKTANYTASTNELVRCNTTSGPFNVTLPTAPIDGALVGILDIMSKFGTYAVTVLPGGSDKVESDTSVILDINHTYAEFVYSTSSANWFLKSTPVGNNILSNTIVDDISNQFNGVTAAFNLTINSSILNTIVDSKDLDVFVNGLKLHPYVDQLRYPWITPYDSGTGFRVANGKIILYKAPFIGSTASLTVKSISSSRQTQRYPFNAITIALGD